MTTPNPTADFLFEKLLTEYDSNRHKVAVITDLTRQVEHLRNMLNAESCYAAENETKLVEARQVMKDKDAAIMKLESTVKDMKALVDADTNLISALCKAR